MDAPDELPHHEAIFFIFLVGRQKRTDMLLPGYYQNWSTSILMAGIYAGLAGCQLSQSELGLELWKSCFQY